ncbi:hypothetical protein BKA64DRAFT_725515 [Cadophora sp. MPI-SDFR-AT-0126]|nr:hypothetical protein BKA64DRAFT_725515 [Leotiomycetes sp. MPI-SDFR-AT-0126]
MTPLPSAAEVASRGLLDPPPGTLHLMDLINQGKDGIYAKDRLSDHVIGMLIYAVDSGMIKAWEGTLFQIPFTKGFSLRKKQLHLGHPSLGPDDKVLSLRGIFWSGEDGHFEKSDLVAMRDIENHPNYGTWMNWILFRGGAFFDSTYDRVTTFNTIARCDKNVNSKPYAPGPLSIVPAPPIDSGEDSSSEIEENPRSSDKRNGVASVAKEAAESSNKYVNISEDDDDDDDEDDDMNTPSEDGPASKSKRDLARKKRAKSTPLRQHRVVKGIKVMVEIRFEGTENRIESVESVFKNAEDAKLFVEDVLGGLEEGEVESEEDFYDEQFTVLKNKFGTGIKAGKRKVAADQE